MRVHRLVLLALAAPIIGIGVVVWFLLPGSVGGLSFSPSQYNREVQLRPVYWEQHDATLRGYVRPMACRLGGCPDMVMSDRLVISPSVDGVGADPSIDIEITAQHESGAHALLRRMLPGFLQSPLAVGNTTTRVTITGRLRPNFQPGQLPVFRPSDL